MMFVGIVLVVLWFTHSSSKMVIQTELQKKKRDIYDKHFTETVQIECQYYRTLYSSNTPECPNCGAETQKILYPKMPE